MPNCFFPTVDSNVSPSSSKTIVHAGSKLSSGEANKVLESMLDQENISETSDTTWRPSTALSSNIVNNKAKVTKVVSKGTKNISKETKVKDKGTKRPLEVESSQQSSQSSSQSSSQATKKQKAEKNKTVRRKLIPQVKGQQQLTKFFRM